MSGEFEAISRLFQVRTPFVHPLTQIANGDDASVHQIPHDMELVISTDSAVSGVHWPVDMSLEIAANRAVEAALSDLAAMGAEPTWLWLAIMAKDNKSLEDMSLGIVQACLKHHVELAGGDTVSSPTNIINVTVAGLVPQGFAMTRKSAHAGDEIWLIGSLGLSALGLKQWQSGEHQGSCVQDFQYIKPQLEKGIMLRELGIQCCMDISDGLLQDASHIAQASQVQMCFELNLLQTLPCYQKLQSFTTDVQALSLMLNGGEDYALLCTAPTSKHQPLKELGATQLGYCANSSNIEGCRVKLMQHGKEIVFDTKGYDHFG